MNEQTLKTDAEKLHEALVAKAEEIRDHGWQTEHDVVQALRTRFFELADVVAAALKGPQKPAEQVEPPKTGELPPAS